MDNRERKDILNSRWTYIDVLLLGLAYLPAGINRLTADSGEWNKIVEELKKKYSTKAPELFSEVHFGYREPLPPHSDQLDDFFHLVGLSDILCSSSPAYQVYELSEATKERIKARRGLKLAQYKQMIEEISSELKKLAI